MNDREWSIQEVARIAGTTSRTLRHYGGIGLLPPSRIASNGYRYYDDSALVRLQRILLLRELGLGLTQIGEAIGPPVPSDLAVDAVGEAEAEALTKHLGALRAEQDRLARQIASVERTIEARRGGEELMVEKMFDGFDHTRHREEVEQRWGADAYASGDRWWRSMTAAEQESWRAQMDELGRDWIAAAESGMAADSAEAQELARRHVAWLTAIPGTPAAAPGGDIAGYVVGLGDMYVADPRFAANYATAAGGTHGAEFVRDALRVHAATSL